MICESDAASTGYCFLWVGGSDVTTLFNGGNRKLSQETSDNCAQGVSAGFTGGALTGVGCGGLPPPFNVGCLATSIIVGTTAGAVTSCTQQSGGCFPATAIVETPSGKKFISEVAVGDFVASKVTSDGELLYEPIYFQGHSDFDTVSAFVKLSLKQLFATNQTVRVLTDNFLFVQLGFLLGGEREYA